MEQVTGKGKQVSYGKPRGKSEPNDGSACGFIQAMISNLRDAFVK